MIIDISAAMLLVGAGPTDQLILSETSTVTESVVAADGGLSTVLAAGLTPAAVFGDGDSLRAASRSVTDPAKIIIIDEQDTTDLEKSLARIRAPLVIGLGFLGGRLDHSLAAMNALIRFADLPVLLIGAEDACFHIPRNLQLNLSKGTRFSLFPFSPAQATSTGLQWPLDPHDFDPMGRIGTSNRATGPVDIQTEDTGMIAIIPRSEWRVAARALWPAFRDG